MASEAGAIHDAMNVRHATALALVNWYLMLPPFSDRRLSESEGSQWKIMGNYDSVDESGKDRRHLLSIAGGFDTDDLKVLEWQTG
jgi:hypothetical protein